MWKIWIFIIVVIWVLYSVFWPKSSKEKRKKQKMTRKAEKQQKIIDINKELIRQKELEIKLTREANETDIRLSSLTDELTALERDQKKAKEKHQKIKKTDMI